MRVENVVVAAVAVVVAAAQTLVVEVLSPVANQNCNNIKERLC